MAGLLQLASQVVYAGPVDIWDDEVMSIGVIGNGGCRGLHFPGVPVTMSYTSLTRERILAESLVSQDYFSAEVYSQPIAIFRLTEMLILNG